MHYSSPSPEELKLLLSQRSLYELKNLHLFKGSRRRQKAKIKNLLEKNLLTQADIARFFGVAYSVVSAVVCAHRTSPLYVMQFLADLYTKEPALLEWLKDYQKHSLAA